MINRREFQRVRVLDAYPNPDFSARNMTASERITEWLLAPVTIWPFKLPSLAYFYRRNRAGKLTTHYFGLGRVRLSIWLARR
jgi:hypothetical protein